MLTRKNRLPIKGKGIRLRKIFSSVYFIVKSGNNDLGFNRFAVIIPNSSVKKSTLRHFWKRAFIEYLKEWPDFGRDFLFIVSPKIENIRKADLRTEIDKILNFVNS
jgi:RNase P protein component